ncbi:glutamine--fructose-6-phosphate transaminase (isomerizing) [Rhodohalobacter mucosus]|uniref:Glutamine--fructose-6-phosphate aminotransferase [isomerizing] n=1 Tax=Rhodohalobacter mucosus TaxID=2079485 RepID=A0A316TU14_9BACT|nr:glutamine--fructose-6-phosphate transaminase (isomerizing) [Rhodohalobacter mucosus]PWN07358.1 glutamine--fructose-6-phosphate transaminase (isomerizing) [Rhodohalobacter mucosus]
MCGIVGYVGDRDAGDVLVKGLKRLEYRGYDSAGVAILNGQMSIQKGKGKVVNLEKLIKVNGVKGNIGIGHTRWATHGEPNDVNSHPHLSESGKVAVVHNGIIENYGSLKKKLSDNGRTFKSQTDTEIIAQLIEEIYSKSKDISFEQAIRLTLKQIVGTYGLAIVNIEEPGKIYIARKGSPLLLGIGDNEMFIASDASPIVEYTNKVVYLDDGEMAVVDRSSYEVKTIEDVSLTKEVHELAISLDEIEKAGYPHFMLKEIFEQPKALADCLRGRINPKKGTVQLGGVADVMDQIVKANRIVIAACGTSWHSALVGEYLFEYLAKAPVEVEYASEFRYRDPLIGEGDVLLVISQSGETADTLAALREARERGALVLGICNVVGSTISRETDAGVFTHAGPEIGVASTKAFTAQVVVLTMMALELAMRKGTITKEKAKKYIKELDQIPGKVEQILKECDETTREMARLFTYAPNFLYLGRSYNFPVALEGALKLKEISYIHAEGYPAAEMKHGPIALIDEMMPVVVIAATDHTNDKMISNIEEVKARKGRIISIMNKENSDVEELSEFSISIPSTYDCFSPLLTVIPLQLLSYYIAVNRGCNVDQPRNLAKSVTVE